VNRSLGVILAGGQSRRYGEPKAFARVAGTTLVERVLDVMRRVTPDVVLVANQPDLYAGLGLEIRSDTRPGMGALGGVYTAVCWAAERPSGGALVVACDMPFLSAALLDRMVSLAAGPAAPAIVAPESDGPRGVEPLCAWYSVRCQPAIEAQFSRDDRRIVGFWDGLDVHRIPLDEVRRHGDPERLFLNVNTPEERAAAESLAAREAEQGS
jgi:molybdopterin-guanine dinucleotide biosynthesis protein A